MKLVDIALVAVGVLAVPACTGPDATSTPPSVTDDGLSTAHLALRGDVAPAHVIVDGAYSDVRFVVSMAAHHRHAIEMASIARDEAGHAEVRAMAAKMVDDQEKEIAELRDLRQSLDGSRDLPTKMHPHSMMNAGVPMPQEVRHGVAVDIAFIDGMLPHHSGAIEMASVALRHTADARIAALARRIIDAQGEEIHEMLVMRRAWYPTLNHGFPHAAEASD